MSGEYVCRRCGAEMVPWVAPSPLWNAVMRDGDINGEWQYDEIICPTCFTVLAGDMAADWVLKARDVRVQLQLVTPTGRVWDENQMLWVKNAELQRLMQRDREQCDELARIHQWAKDQIAARDAVIAKLRGVPHD